SWVGVYHGPWALPANAAELILELVENREKEVRWRAVQGLAIGRPTAGHLSAAQVVPALLRRLSDDYNRIRGAAALALAQRGEAVLDISPDAIGVLIRALDAYTSRDWGDTAPGLDSDSSVCGHASRLLAAVSHRLTPEQRQSALVAIDRAIPRYGDRQNEYVSFQRMSIQASRVLQDQRQLLAQPTEWELTELFREVAFVREDHRLSPLDCDRKLADAYARAPDETIAAAIEAIRDAAALALAQRGEAVLDISPDAIGAAQWLMTLGPAAEPALDALDAMASGQSYAQKRARAAGTYIRQSLLVTRDGGEKPSQGDFERARVAQLLRVAAGAGQSGGSRGALMAESVRLTQHPDAYVRAGAAEGLALLMAAPDEVAAAVPALEQMLTDEAFAEIGISGEYECEGRLFHWRQERRSPRASAITALFAIGWVPAGDAMLKAMLAESMRAKILCGKSAVACRFTFAQWQQAVDAAGGYSVVGPLIHSARQQVRNERYAGHNGPHACAAELSEVIRRLSGRLV
ncbi:MAG: HEAT repeat domain-containing protein, partial [Bradyrhizobiaceae bacterium]|nr:HEAT repeat domain-containing protein [Bradyrhizobiaceae bacterium]